MTTSVAIKNIIHSQLVRVDSVFVNPFLLEDFNHMREVLGGDCFAIALPHDIVLWCATPIDRSIFEHTVTIQIGKKAEHLLGNVLITSNDEDSLNGICSLSEHQLKWLRENFYLEKSELHGNYVMKFYA